MWFLSKCLFTHQIIPLSIIAYRLVIFLTRRRTRIALKRMTIYSRQGGMLFACIGSLNSIRYTPEWNPSFLLINLPKWINWIAQCILFLQQNHLKHSVSIFGLLYPSDSWRHLCLSWFHWFSYRGGAPEYYWTGWDMTFSGMTLVFYEYHIPKHLHSYQPPIHAIQTQNRS